MASEKKILSPVLYPSNKDVTRKWFIKYYEADYVKGGLRPFKYYGMLNRVSGLDERLKLAQSYIDMMERGEPLPVCQGLKTVRALDYQKVKTNVIECCNRYLLNKQLEQLRNSTIIDYRSKIKIFGAWLQTQGKQNSAIGAIDKETAMEFLMHIKARGLSNSSFNDYRTLFGSIWHEYKDKIHTNPWREIKSVRQNVQHLKSYPVVLQQRIKETLPEYDKQLWLFVQFVYYCAIRPHSELRFLQVKHINFEKGMITVPAAISKTHKARTINVFHKLIEQLKEANYHTFPPEYYLFGHCSAPGENHVSKNYFGYRWSDYRKAKDIDSSFKLYGSKHTGGKNLTKITNAYITKEHFGHQSLEQTQNYIDDLDISELTFLQKDYPEFAGEAAGTAKKKLSTAAGTHK